MAAAATPDSLSLRWVGASSAEYQQILDLREEVLRKPLGMVLDRSDLSAEADAFHLGAWLGSAGLVGTLQLRPEPDSQPSIIRMRAVAVSSSHRGSGVGAALVREAERRAAQLGFAEVTAHARVEAMGFYEAMGYVPEGPTFIEVTLAHRIVRKPIVTSAGSPAPE